MGQWEYANIIYMYVDVFAKVFIVLDVSQQVQWDDLVVKYRYMLNYERNSTDSTFQFTFLCAYVILINNQAVRMRIMKN